MSEEFISEPIEPVTATFDTGRMASGEPGMPREFIWRKEKFIVREILRSWKKTGACRHGSGEMYVRKHFYEIVTDSGVKMKIYFDRQPSKGKAKSPRWWLLSRERIRIHPIKILSAVLMIGFIFAVPVFPAEEHAVFLVADLKEGGYVIFLRHARRDDTPSQSALWELDGTSSCKPGGSLNARGESETRDIMDAIKRLNIPAGEIYASPTCRTKQMARIMFGENFTITQTLAPPWVKIADDKEKDKAALNKLLSRAVAPGQNRFLISHGHLLTEEAVGMEIKIDQTEAAVFRPDGKAGYEFLGVIHFKDWETAK